MIKQMLKDFLGWGFALWLVGYAVGIMLFSFVAPALIGWIIMPIGIAATLWVLLRKVKGNAFQYYLGVAVSWTAIAVALDYLFIVKAFKPADGYYKPDVYLYYALTFLIPISVGWWKKAKHNETMASGS